MYNMTRNDSTTSDARLGRRSQEHEKRPNHLLARERTRALIDVITGSISDAAGPVTVIPPGLSDAIAS